MNRLCLAGILIATAALGKPPGPSFEVATIKPAARNQNGYGINWAHGCGATEQRNAQGAPESNLSSIFVGWK
jgi:hypothetical protein